jgi:phage major head subunit gpT-like protein
MASINSLVFRSNLTKLYSERLPFIDEILFEPHRAPEMTYQNIFNVRDSARAYEEILGMVGLGLFKTKQEGEPVDYDKFAQGFSKRFTHDTFANGYMVTWEAAEDDLDGVIAQAMPELRASAQRSIEISAYDDLNSGFSTVLGMDGVSFFNAAHPLAGPGATTFSNLISADLAQGPLESALNRFDDMQNDRGLLINLEARNLIVPSELKWLAHELLRSQLRSDTANNAVNALTMIGLNPIVIKYLTNAENWFLATDPSDHRLMYYWRKEPFSDNYVDPETLNLKTKMLYRMSHGVADWRGWIGGQG